MPAPGVPARFPVPLPLLVNATPLGSAPVSVKAGTGDPVDVTVKDPAPPTMNVAWLTLVIDGAVPPPPPPPPPPFPPPLPPPQALAKTIRASASSRRTRGARRCRFEPVENFSRPAFTRPGDELILKFLPALLRFELTYLMYLPERLVAA